MAIGPEQRLALAQEELFALAKKINGRIDRDLRPFQKWLDRAEILRQEIKGFRETLDER